MQGVSCRSTSDRELTLIGTQPTSDPNSGEVEKVSYPRYSGCRARAKPVPDGA